MRPYFVVLVIGFSAALFSGCGPNLSEEELGNVVYKIPEIPGAETPRELPPLTEHIDESGDPHAGHDHP